ncbi:MAG: YgiT-type zinc finger protein [bacterium]|nr:YgiT-type zinc finger protein [bacterium]
MKCAICPSENAILITDSVTLKDPNGKDVIIQDIEMYTCNDCGEKYLDRMQARIMSLKAEAAGIEIKRRRWGLPLPDQS